MTTTLARMFKQEMSRQVARYAAERWITIGGGEGEGTHVKIDDKGNIVGGPEALTGKNLDSLSDSKPAAGKLKQPRRGAGTMRASEIISDPSRFQYKLGVGKEGVTDQFSDIGFNPAFAGQLHVWEDPADGKTYVINGHHRLELAKRSGHEDELSVYHIEAHTAKEARAFGALANIAGGNGTALDAASFIRDTGVGPEEMRKEGVSLKGGIAKEAMSLRKMPDRIFDKLVRGTYRTSRALALAEHLHNPDDIDRVDRRIEKYEDRTGKTVTDGAASEMARQESLSKKLTETQSTLFGDWESEHSTAVERAEISASFKRELATKLNKFRAVSTARAGELLSEGGNVIHSGQNKVTADKLATALEDFTRESSYTGPISDILNQGAEELYRDPKRKKEITERVSASIRDALSAIAKADSGAVQADGPASAGDDAERKRIDSAPGQRGMFSRQGMIDRMCRHAWESYSRRAVTR